MDGPLTTKQAQILDTSDASRFLPQGSVISPREPALPRSEARIALAFMGLPWATLLNRNGEEATAPKDRSAIVAAQAHQARWRAEELDGWPPGPPTHPGAKKRYATIESCLAEECKAQRVEAAART
jgi:hypothetical protein